MKVYIVTQGCYSDYHICAVFLTKHEAEIYCAAQHDAEDDLDDFYIDERDTDADHVEVAPGTKIHYHVIMRKGFCSTEFDRVRVYKTLKPLSPFKFVKPSYYLDGRYEAVLDTNDEDKILKIFRDWLAQKKAEEAGL